MDIQEVLLILRKVQISPEVNSYFCNAITPFFNKKYKIASTSQFLNIMKFSCFQSMISSNQFLVNALKLLFLSTFFFSLDRVLTLSF